MHSTPRPKKEKYIINKTSDALPDPDSSANIATCKFTQQK
jgi:hypothetical protein